VKITESKLRSIIRSEIKGAIKESAFYDEGLSSFISSNAVEQAMTIFPIKKLVKVISDYRNGYFNMYDKRSELFDMVVQSTQDIGMDFNQDHLSEFVDDLQTEVLFYLDKNEPDLADYIAENGLEEAMNWDGWSSFGNKKINL